MNLFLVLLLVLVALGGAAVALSREPIDQAMAAGFQGLLLSVLFVTLQAPDVALSQVVAGALAFPLMLVLAVARVGWRCS